MHEIWREAEQAIFDVFGHPTTQLPADAIRELGRRIDELEARDVRNLGALPLDGSADHLVFEDIIGWVARGGIKVTVNSPSVTMRLIPAEDSRFPSLPEVVIMSIDAAAVVDIGRERSEWLSGNLTADQVDQVVRSSTGWVEFPSIVPADPVAVLADFLAEVVIRKNEEPHEIRIGLQFEQ